MSAAHPAGLAILEHDGVEFGPSADALVHDATSCALLGHPANPMARELVPPRNGSVYGGTASDGGGGPSLATTADGRTAAVRNRALVCGVASAACLALERRDTSCDRSRAMRLGLAGRLLAPLALWNLLVVGAVRGHLSWGKRAVAVPVARWLGFWAAAVQRHPPPTSGQADAASLTK